MYEMTASHMASLILENWIVFCEIRSQALTDIGEQCTKQLFETMRSFLKTMHLTKREHQQQTKGQAGQFKETMIGRL